MKKLFPFLAIIAMIMAISCSKEDPLGPDDPIIIPPPDTTDNHKKDTVRFIFEMDLSAFSDYVVVEAAVTFNQYPFSFLSPNFSPKVDLKSEFEMIFVGDTATNILGRPMVIIPSAAGYYVTDGPPGGRMYFEPEYIKIDSMPKELTLHFAAKY